MFLVAAPFGVGVGARAVEDLLLFENFVFVTFAFFTFAIVLDSDFGSWDWATAYCGESGSAG